MNSSYQIGEVFEQIRNGLTVENDPKSGGLPITRIETIANGEIDSVRVGYSGIEAGEKDGWLLKEGDILFSHINSLSHIGKCAIYEGVPEQLIHGMNLLSFRAKKEILLPEYALYLFRSNTFKSKLAKSIKPSVNQASVGIKDIQKIPVDIPPLETQKHIACVLEQADRLRKQAQQMESELNQLAQSLFLEMFGDPVTNPKGWDKPALRNYIRELRNGLSRRAALGEIEQDIVLRLQDIRANSVRLEAPNRMHLSQIEKERYKVNAQDLIFIRVNGNKDYVGRCAVWKDESLDVYHNDHIIKLRLSKDFEPEFLSFIFNERFGKHEINKQVKTSAGQFTISQDGIEKLEVIKPPIDVQKAFVKQWWSILEKREQVLKALREYEDLFNSLMQRAFNGELTTPQRKAA
jgi:type I restriction enzyme, S subunit